MAGWIHRFELKPGTWVFVPNTHARKYGNALKKDLERKWHVSEYYSHLLPGGHVRALQLHLGQKTFMRADIEGFYGQIGRSRITRNMKYFYSYEKARVVAEESTVRSPADPSKFILPFGFVQSPILASICLQKSSLGVFLEDLNRLPGVVVSVYMDDIIVSTNLDRSGSTNLFDDMCEAAERSSFAFGLNKLEPPCDQITAFNIELSHELMEVEVGRLEELVFDAISTESEQVRNGILSYVQSVSPAQAAHIAGAI